jgi:predicted nucleic acid-binding protein
MIYSDTSALTSILYHRVYSRCINDSLKEIKQPIIIWKFGEVELGCALKSMMRDPKTKLTDYQRKEIFQKLDILVNLGKVIISRNINADLVMEIAKIMIERPHFDSRSLDTIHVASAKVLDVSYFISTDHNQRKLAEGEGLTVIPIKLDEEVK